MTKAEIAAWLNLPDGQEPGQEVITALADIPVPRTDAEQLAVFRAYLSAVPLAPGAVMTGEVNRRGPADDDSPTADRHYDPDAAWVAGDDEAPSPLNPRWQGPEAEWSPAEAGAAVAAALDAVGPAPGLWSPSDSPGATVFHSPFCTCGHKQTLHAGADSDGRCVKRSCGCGRFTLSPRRQR